MTDRHGPIRIHGYIIEIDGVETSGWRSVTLPASSTETASGSGVDGWGDTTFQDLEMERAYDDSDNILVDWRDEVVDGDEDGLKELAVTIIDDEGEGVEKWTFEDAWITYYEPPRVDPFGDSNVASERITVAYDSFEREEV